MGLVAVNNKSVKSVQFVNKCKYLKGFMSSVRQYSKALSTKLYDSSYVRSSLELWFRCEQSASVLDQEAYCQKSATTSKARFVRDAAAIWARFSSTATARFGASRGHGRFALSGTGSNASGPHRAQLSTSQSNVSL